MAFTLPELPFDPNQLSPFNSKETFDYHHGKHHATYVTKLNDAIKGTEMDGMDLAELIRKAHQESNKPVYNNAAQHYNHTFFWNCLTPNSAAPGAKLTEALNKDFGSVDAFKEQFSAAAVGLFGSGWAWLAQNSDGKLEIMGLKDADSPLITGKNPLLTLDVWEHAYYIDHRNARPQFIAEFWKVVNWAHAEKLMA
jgi:Fe-Mn family superoxide dismutase